MQNKHNSKIRKFIVESILKEAAKEKEKKTFNELDRMISDVRGKLIDLNDAFVSHGLSEDSRVFLQIEKMSHILADLDPVKVKMKDMFAPTPNTQLGAEALVGEGEDLKMNPDADRDMKKKAVDMSKDYQMDIQLTDEQ
jgi:hypothetical protein